MSPVHAPGQQILTPTTGAVGPAFQTDVEISGTSDVAKERELHRWQPGTADRVDLTMDSGGIGDWDQFAANEKLYNVQTDFDESLYTTTIDRKDPKYKQAEQRAARLAREIERDSASRKLAVTDSGLDEEDKCVDHGALQSLLTSSRYSGVIRGSTAQAKAGQEVYVPPSKRPQGKPQATPTAPNDPAIIFSQLARPGGSFPGPSSRTEAGADAIDGSEAEQRATTNKSGVDTPAINVNVQSPKDGQGAPKKTDNYYQDVYESFKQFTVQEKQRIQNHQKALAQQRNTNARQEKSVKLNDLRKFSQNFKLTSRVPEDLVPILAKSKEKQNEIRDKAEQQAIDQEHPLTKSSPTPKEAKPTMAAVSTPPTTLNAVKKSAQPGSGNLAPIQAGNSIQPTFKPDSGIASPSFSANAKLNVKAMEFRPNPGAASFAPGGRNTSPGPRVPQKPNGPSPSPVAPERSAAVFSFARPAVLENERQYSFEDAYNPLRLMLQETAADEQKMQQSVRNGGIPHAYRTAPTWEVPESNIEKSYVDLFAHSHNRSPVPITRSNSGMPHQQQLPPHLQGGQSHGQGSPRYLQAQAQQYGHLGPDEQRIPYGQPNQRQRGGNGPQGYMYNGQAFNPQMQNYAYGMPPGSVGPGGHMRAMGANGQLLGHGPMSPMGAGGHMMVQQASNGAMAQQFGMYSSPGASHAQPHMMPGQMGGYAGSPRAHPMGHQGSQQSHNGYNAGGPASGPMMMMMSPQQNGQSKHSDSDLLNG